jgi:hypothetical protein
VFELGFAPIDKPIVPNMYRKNIPIINCKPNRILNAKFPLGIKGSEPSPETTLKINGVSIRKSAIPLNRKNRPKLMVKSVVLLVKISNIDRCIVVERKTAEIQASNIPEAKLSNPMFREILI